MRLRLTRLGYVAAALLGMCAIARAEHGHVMRQCSPLCGPCIPERVTYGYFPTVWRRWPTEYMQAGSAPTPEEVPTPAQEEPLPTIEPETPEAAGPSTGEPTAPAEPPESPLVPPLDPDSLKPPTGSGPTPAPFEDTPSEVPFEEAPLFEDSPPALPPEGSGKSESTSEPNLPTQATPAVPDGDLPPTMPDDDPFKDDPDAELGVPGAAPASGASMPDELAPQQAAVGWSASGGSRVARPPESDKAPRRLPIGGEEIAPPSTPLPAMRINSLRSASRSADRHAIVPAVSYSAADSTDRREWRRNPLRPN